VNENPSVPQRGEKLSAYRLESAANENRLHILLANWFSTAMKRAINAVKLALNAGSNVL
jgi:hypothetical protein